MQSQLNEIMKMHEQNKKFYKETDTINRQQKSYKNPRTEKYDHSMEEFNGYLQKQTQPWRKKNRWSRKEGTSNYLVRGTKIKRVKKIYGTYGTWSKKLYACNGNSRRERKREKCIFSNSGWTLPNMGERDEHPNPWGPKELKGYTEKDYN